MHDRNAEAKAPQPDRNVHDGAYNRGRRASSVEESEGVQGGVRVFRTFVIA